MLDIHPPHEAAHTWKDFFIHVATICVGLLIAIGLEQAVEAEHHHHQREQVVEDLRTEAEANHALITRDLKIQSLEPWFSRAIAASDATPVVAGRLKFTLPVSPCLPGSIGTAEYRYFAPSEAVWTTARESGLVALLPVEESRRYARLAHNLELLAANREDVYRGCHEVLSMQYRLARKEPDGMFTWTLTPEQAEKLAQHAADTRLAIKALCFRLRWTESYEQAIYEHNATADAALMTMNQEGFEDPEDRMEPVPATAH
jgi:hypothetical protein